MTLRQQLDGQAPALSYHFGLKPWELDDLTHREAGAYLAALDEIRAEHERQRQKAEQAEQQTGRATGRGGS